MCLLENALQSEHETFDFIKATAQLLIEHFNILGDVAPPIEVVCLSVDGMVVFVLHLGVFTLHGDKLLRTNSKHGLNC